jgi:EAL domain-containing protein (putative c-di-GMP-specific phosphodiesterase class I)
MMDDPIDLAMVKSINEIGQVMGKKTIAEFVENDRIFAKLREIGVDFAQGYWIGRPRPIEEWLEPGTSIDAAPAAEDPPQSMPVSSFAS